MSQKQVERTRKIKVKEIIDDLDLIHLRTFILQYAKNDPSFEIAFKTHFISRIRTGIDENKKYKRILDEIIKPKNANNQKIGPTLKKTIVIVFKDLALQMNDCLSTDNFTEAYSLVKESLEKIEYLQHRYIVKDQSIAKCRMNFLEGLDMILDEELAPAFRKKIESELKEITQKSYFFPQKDNLLELLNNKNILVEEDKQNAISLLVQKRKDAPDINNLIQTCIQLSHPFIDLAQNVTQTFANDQIFKALKGLIKEGKFKYVDFYLDNNELKFNFDKTILNILKLIEKKEFKLLSKELKKLTLDNTAILQIRSIVDELSDAYLKKEFASIKDWIDNLPFGMQSGMYYKAQNGAQLCSLLENKNDIEWLKVYDNGLIKMGFEKEVFRLYQALCSNYIANHLGLKAKNYLDKVQLHLIKHGRHEFSEKLRNHISREFKHRISLN